MLCILAVRFSPRDTVETTDGAIDVERARERPVLVEDAPGTRELRLAWGSSAGGMSCAPDVTPAPLGTGAAHLVIERVEVLGAIDRRAVEAHRLLARFPCCALLLESNRPLGRALRGPRLRDALPLPLGSIRLPPATFLLVPCAALRAGATGPRIGCSFRAAALSAHLRPQPHSRPAAGTTNNLVWWAVVDFLAELPQAGFPCSGEVLTRLVDQPGANIFVDQPGTFNTFGRSARELIGATPWLVSSAMPLVSSTVAVRSPRSRLCRSK